MFNSSIINTIIVFVLIMIIILIIKPSFLYDHDKNEFKKFGTEDNETILNIYSISVLLAFFLYIFFNSINKKRGTFKKINNIDPNIEGFNNNDILKQIMNQQLLNQQLLSRIMD